jgi:hypothetical protein
VLSELSIIEGGVVSTVLIVLLNWARVETFQRRNGGQKVADTLRAIGARLEQLTIETHELHEWHDVCDRDGVKLWYVRRSVEDAVSKLADSIATQNVIFGEFRMTLHEILKTLERKGVGSGD